MPFLSWSQFACLLAVSCGTSRDHPFPSCTDREVAWLFSDVVPRVCVWGGGGGTKELGTTKHTILKSNYGLGYPGHNTITSSILLLCIPFLSFQDILMCSQSLCLPGPLFAVGRSSVVVWTSPGVCPRLLCISECQPPTGSVQPGFASGIRSLGLV